MTIKAYIRVTPLVESETGELKPLADNLVPVVIEGTNAEIEQAVTLLGVRLCQDIQTAVAVRQRAEQLANIMESLGVSRSETYNMLSRHL